MARNVEVLRNYFLGKDPQLKETLSDNSLRLIGIEGRHFVLRTELIQRIKELKDYVDEQDKDLQDAIDTLADTLENEIDRLENKYNITEDTRIYELDNGVYRVTTPEIRLYFKQNGSMINDDDLILIKEAKSFFIFSTVPSTDHPAMTYGIADASDGWRATLMFEEIEQTTNKKNTITQNSTDYPSGLAVFNALSNYYTKGQVDALISFIPEFDIDVVETLPTQDISTTTIYLVPSQEPQTANSYDEFIYVDNNWEQIGSTAIDLSNYYTKEEVDAKTFLTTLTQDITIPEHSSSVGLTTGWYYTGEHLMYFGDSVDPVTFNNSIFYYNAEDLWFYFLPPNIENGWGQICVFLGYDTVEEKWDYYGYDIRGSMVGISDQSNDFSIPTAKAVYNLFASLGEGIEDLPQPATLNTLDPGIYRTHANNTITYKIEDVPPDPPARSILVLNAEGYMVVTVVGNMHYFELFQTNSIDYGYMEYMMSSNGGCSTLNFANIKTTAFTGTDGVNAGTIGLVPAPLAADDGKFLCADGTWAEVSGGANYSTTEQVVGTWIDGKPLYEITLTGTLPTYQSSTINTDITISSNVDFAFIVNQFIVSSSGSNTILPKTSYYVDDVPTIATDHSTMGYIYGATKKYRIVQNTSNADGYTYYAIIRYTKTTDNVS